MSQSIQYLIIFFQIIQNTMSVIAGAGYFSLYSFHDSHHNFQFRIFFKAGKPNLLFKSNHFLFRQIFKLTVL